MGCLVRPSSAESNLFRRYIHPDSSPADVMVKPKTVRGPFRNPLIVTRELQAKMLMHNLTRVQLWQRHGITSDRITQWLCLLKLPEVKQREIEALGDHWERRFISERELRSLLRPSTRGTLSLTNEFKTGKSTFIDTTH